MRLCAMQNRRKILGVLLVAAAAVSFLISLRTMRTVDWKHVPVPNQLPRAGSYARSPANKLLHTFGGDENSPKLTTADMTTEKTTLSTEQTAAVGFEHTEVFKRFVTQQPGNHTDVAEYLASVKAYLVNFTSPMIRRTATEYSWPETEEETRQRQSRSNSSGKAMKRIVWHNCPSSRRESPDVVSSHCPVKDCQMSYHYSDHRQAAAVVFWMKGIRTLPPRDHVDQVYVFYNMESPINTNYRMLLKPGNSVFNWTWNYRLDSDVFNPQNYLRQSLSIPSHSQLLKRMQRKTKMIAWFVSHCNTQSKREDYVKKLQKVVPVDIYGGCGPLKCARKNSTSCVSKLNDYFFYLSFENSICKEYITEKYYNTFYQGVNVLSVVRGGANYSRFFPEGTFIDADWFKGPEELGRYMLALARDPARYVDLMWRRAHFVRHESGEPDALCRLCYKLHHLELFNKTYTNLFALRQEGQCKKPNPF